MAVNDKLGKRMKEFYENVPETKLVRGMPVAIRIDGNAFHSFTKGFVRPFDTVLRNAMNGTMKYLCEHIQGCVLGYCQSDEITLILANHQTLNSDAWSDYEIQKLSSISASMATMWFNMQFDVEIDKWYYSTEGPATKEMKKQQVIYFTKNRTAMFDARCFNIPKEEVANLIYWRQLDAMRNSIQLAGQTYFSHSQLQKKSCNEIQDMLFTEKGINWNDYDTMFKRGACCIKVDGEGWKVDTEIPIFKGDGREYIEKLI